MPNIYNKPVADPTGCGGSAVLNDPVMTDGTTASPIAVGSKNIIIPDSAFRVHFLCVGTTDTLGCTVSKKLGSTAIDGAVKIPCGVEVVIDIGGANSSDGLFFDSLDVVAAVETSYWFDCETPGGA